MRNYHPILQKALQKLGVKSYNDLNELEKETFKQWEQSLAQGDSITSEEVVESVRDMLEQTLTKLEDENLSEKARTFLLCQMKIVKYVLRTIESPRAEVRKIVTEVSQLGSNKLD